MPHVLDGVPMTPGQPFATGDVQYPANVLELWTAEELAAIGVTWVEPDPAPGLTVEEALAALADLRWRRTQAMPAYDGATDVPADTARSVITSKVLAAQFLTDEQKAAPQAFKLKPGEWRNWNVADLVAYGLAIGVYMQACFDREQALEGEIIAAADPASIDITTGWPG